MRAREAAVAAAGAAATAPPAALTSTSHAQSDAAWAKTERKRGKRRQLLGKTEVATATVAQSSVGKGVPSFKPHKPRESYISPRAGAKGEKRKK